MHNMFDRLKNLLHGVLGGSIRRKMTISFALAALAIMFGFGYTIVRHERAFLMQQSAIHAQDFAHAIAVSSTSWVIANDVVGLQEVLQSVARLPNLRYAMVLSANGRVLASTQPENVGRFVQDSVSQRLLVASSMTPLVLVDQPQLVDAAAPVLAGERLLGWVRIALGREQVAENLHEVAVKSYMVTGIALFVILLIAMGLSRGLTAGLEKLMQVARLVHVGRRDVRVGMVRADEIGVLANEFDNMLDALEHSESDLARLNQVLQENEERWRFALEGAGDGVWDWDVQSGEVHYSMRWLELLGFSPGEIGASLDERKRRIHPDDAEKVMADLQTHLDKLTISYASEHRMLCRDGNWKWVLERGMVINRNAEGMPLRVLGTLSDISARKLAEAEISRLAQAVEQNPTGVVITTPAGELEYTNQAYTRITGYQFGEVYGKPLRELISAELSDQEFQNISTCLSGGRAWSGTLNSRRRNGSMYWEQVSATAIYDDSGKICNYLFLKTDVTERVKVQAVLEQRDAELLRANADLTRFADVSAHHLMEPARRLVSYTQLLRPHLVARPEIMEEEDVRDSLDAIEKSALRLRTLVRDIQLYLAAGEPRGEPREEDANAALSAVEQRLVDRLATSSTKLTAERLPPAWLDRPRLMDLFEILLDNALNYGRPPDPARKPEIVVSGERVGNASRYFVSDNGPGIPEAYRERVFGIFERLGASGGEGGTGIGLSIARRIVESRGGKIWIETLQQGGTKVAFELPDEE